MGNGEQLMKMMVIESKTDELVPERYAANVMESSKRITHWDTIEVSEDDYYRYEGLRIALEELVIEIKDKGKK
jgi:hypothetical protein